MDLSVLGPSATFYLAAIVFLTQLLKEGLRLKGFWLQVVPVILGILFAFGGLQDASALLLPGFPHIAATIASGVLLGASATGGYATVTWLQDRNATVKAEATVKAQQGAGIALPVALGTPTTDVPQPLPDGMYPPSFTPAPEEPLLEEHANNLIAPPLPRTMAILPDPPPDPLDLRFPPVPFG